jgi:hypothetical protein
VFDRFLEDFKADAFVEFAKSNLALEENKITGFLSSELARADRGEIPVGPNNRSVSSDFFPCHYDDSDNLAGDEPILLREWKAILSYQCRYFSFMENT